MTQVHWLSQLVHVVPILETCTLLPTPKISEGWIFNWVMNACSFTIHFKKLCQCSKMRVEWYKKTKSRCKHMFPRWPKPYKMANWKLGSKTTGFKHYDICWWYWNTILKLTPPPNRMDALSYCTRQRVTRVVLKVIRFIPHVAQAPNHIQGILSWQELLLWF